ncbi:TPA: tail fiber assembly protein [Stenotrophomonas maltophilia]
MNVEMYAVTGTGYRAIREEMELLPGETAMPSIPASLLLRISADQVRLERSQRLRATDWTQAPDSPLDPAAKLAWAAYRQELRDLPERAGFPNCAWPVPPALPESAAGQERAPLQN